MVREIHIVGKLRDDVVASLEGRQIDERYFRTLLRDEDVDVHRSDGSVLLKLRARVLPAKVVDNARDALRRTATKTDNRGMAAGGRFRRRLKNGRWDKRSRARKEYSGAFGFLECRTTQITGRDLLAWRSLVPFARAVGAVFAREYPERYAAQMAKVARTRPRYIIPGTPFTTITPNRNFATTVHKDSGDLPEGFGVISVIRSGDYSGGYLVLPQYEIAVDLDSRDVLLYDVHEFHGNTPIIGAEGEYERLSAVFYYRTKMIDCR